MPTMFSDNLTQFELTEPQLTRWRHRYRGQRESYKFNVESDQMLYDIITLYATYDSLRADVKADHALMVEGGELEDVAFEYEVDGNPVSDDPLTILGIEALASEVELLRLRLQALED